jgi:hypothetical protein
MLTGWLVVRQRTRWLLLALLFGHACGTELLQYLMDVGRTGSVRDVGLDWLGIALGVALTWKWYRLDQLWPAAGQDRSQEAQLADIPGSRAP